MCTRHAGVRLRALSWIAVAAWFAANPSAGDVVAPETAPGEGAHAPADDDAACAHQSPLRRPLFGDLHVHTRFSLDAATMDTRNGPAEAYRFARGERIGIQPYDANGQPLRTVQLARPLDFAAVTDHAEVFGELAHCRDPKLTGHASLQCQAYRGWPRMAFFWMNFTASLGQRPGFCGESGSLCRNASRGPWREIQRAAEEADDDGPACSFTAFTGYEWTGSVGSAANLHRNVIFATNVVPELPTSFLDESEPEGLWDALTRDCRAADGCEALIIPHNSNLGDGFMFATVDATGAPIGEATAAKRHRYERLVEIMQHKGESECRTGFGTSDELCGFEKLSTTNMSARFLPWSNGSFVPRMYVRHALQEGLAEKQRLGVNPFQYGIIASTDTHLGTPGLVDESASFPGHGGAGPPPGDSLAAGGLPDAIDFNPGGLAVVWAEENSRRSIYAALQRRETYGTSGPRIEARLFAGFGLDEGLCDAPDRVARAYEAGVPMGGELVGRTAVGRPLRLLVSARADAGDAGAPGTDLQRIQIVKGWLEGETLRERVVDVAGGDNGARVDTATCEPSGDGARELCAVWTDTEFDPAQSAFYYARVVENPTCRWSQKLCLAAQVTCDGDAANVPAGFEDCCSAEHVPVIQERAWTSPIWIDPGTP